MSFWREKGVQGVAEGWGPDEMQWKDPGESGRWREQSLGRANEVITRRLRASLRGCFLWTILRDEIHIV